MKKAAIIVLTISASLVLIILGLGRLRSASFILYPKLDIYKKGYNPGKNENLQFQGYYEYIDGARIRRQTEKSGDSTDYFFPWFFYQDGSFCCGYMPAGNDSLRAAIGRLELVWYDKRPYVEGLRWGNFLVVEDTILLESWNHTQGILFFPYEKTMRKGVIYHDSIVLYNEERDRLTDPRTVVFAEFNSKPDSTLNWFRVMKYYN